MFVDEASVDDQRDEDEESEAVAPLDALVLSSFCKVDNGGDEEGVIDYDEDQNGGAVNGRPILGIQRTQACLGIETTL